ncbi:MAG: MFS transporter [Anaeromyxobacteraceae bacterium]|nr:MFS transporter [Anaeromyxobacteraceae bacterium]
MPALASERTLLFLVGAVQFVNVLDFMMVMPLGPDFAAGLGIPASSLGLVGGAYTAAAAVAGLIASTFLDRFDRRRALAVAMLGLVLATAAGGTATGLGSMVAARVAAGAFGGPATSLSLSIVADAVPAERRGKALGAVMGAFSVASVLGVPAGLELAHLGTWRLPFFAVAALGLVVAGAALWLMPPMTGHLARAAAPRPAPPLLRSRPAILSLSATATSMLSGFAIIPNIAAHLQLNLGFPRDRLGGLYMAGGAVSFVVLRVAGRWVDRFGSPRVAAAGTAVFVGVMLGAFAFPPPWLPVIVVFPLFMIGNSLRNVSTNTLSSRVPSPAERARFMSAQSAVQHLASAVGAGLSTRLLVVEPEGRLGGVRALALFSVTVALALPVLLLAVSRALSRREAALLQTAHPVETGLR